MFIYKDIFLILNNLILVNTFLHKDNFQKNLKYFVLIGKFIELKTNEEVWKIWSRN